MTDERYEPVACDYHDQLEEAAMHCRDVELEFDLEGVAQRETGRVSDVFTANGAEYILFQGLGGPLEIRLDRIIFMRST